MYRDLEKAIVDLVYNRVPIEEDSAGAEKWVESVCSFCGSGCGLEIGIKDDQIVALRGRADYPVNQGRLCVKGVYQWKALRAFGRAHYPMLKGEGSLQRCSWDSALGEMTEKIKRVLKKDGPEAVGIYTTGQLTLEECYAAGKLARGVIGTPNIDANLRLCMSSAVEGYIRSFGSDGPPACYRDLEIADCILIFGCNPAEMHPQIWRKIAARKREGAKVIVVDPRKTIPARSADLHLRINTGTNLYLLNSFAAVIMEEGLHDRDFIEQYTVGFSDLREILAKYTPENVTEITGISARKIREAALIFAKSSKVTTLYGQGVFQTGSATHSVAGIINLHLITGKIGKPGCGPLALTGQSNSMGNREAGGGATFVGYRNPANPDHRREVARIWKVPEERLPYHTNDIMTMLEMIERGKLKVLWVMGTNPAVSLPDLNYARELLDRVYLIVQDIYYPVETSAFADVFLPVAAWGEKTGTFTNSERRVALAAGAVPPPGEAKSDLEIISEVAKELGAGELFSWRDSEEVFEEWKLLSRGRPCDMTGISYSRLKVEGGIQWPCPEPGHPGTPRLYTQHRFNTAPEMSQRYGTFNDEKNRARIRAVEPAALPIGVDSHYPLWLNTGRVLEHFHTRTKTKRIEELNLLVPEAFVEINPVDAEKRGIKNDDPVEISSPRGKIVARARVEDTVPKGQVFVPFHFGDLDPGENKLPRAANRLVEKCKDPVSGQPLFKNSVCDVQKYTEPMSKYLDRSS